MLEKLYWGLYQAITFWITPEECWKGREIQEIIFMFLSIVIFVSIILITIFLLAGIIKIGMLIFMMYLKCLYEITERMLIKFPKLRNRLVLLLQRRRKKVFYAMKRFYLG